MDEPGRSAEARLRIKNGLGGWEQNRILPKASSAEYSRNNTWKGSSYALAGENSNLERGSSA